MKKTLSRIFAGFLAAALVISSGSSTVYAGFYPGNVTGKTAEAAPEKTTPSDVTPSDTALKDALTGNAPADNTPTEDTSQKNITSEEDNLQDLYSAPKELMGAVEVQLVSGIQVNKPQNFNVVLSGEGNDTFTKQITLPGSEEGIVPEAAARFPKLKAGRYQLKISGTNYITYQQDIQVDETGVRVQIYTGSIPQLGEGTAHPGVIRYGDVLGDGSLDEKDESRLVDGMEEKQQDPGCDLNGDGVVDLLDLNYFTTLKEVKEQQSTLERLLPLEVVTVKAPGDTVVKDGSLENLLTGEGGKTVLGSAGGSVISDENPVVVDFDIAADHETKIGGIVIEPPRGSEKAVAAGEALIVYEKDGQDTHEFVEFSAQEGLLLLSAPDQTYEKSQNFKVSWDKNGALIINLGGQIAVKHVTLKITKTADSKNLAEISRVEFLGDMESRIPEPSADIPVGLRADAGNKSFTVSWNGARNVTGYEVLITSEGRADLRKTTSTSLKITQFAKDKLKNGTEYTISVRSTNGEWKSAYSGEVTAVPKVSSKPDAPEEVSAKGSYRSVDVRWKKTEDADSYNVYWKEEGESQFHKIEGIEGLYYQISDLKDNTNYVVYVTAVNELGESSKSREAADRTLSGLIDAKLPSYKLINTSNGNGVLSSHIVSASVGGASMVDSKLDTETGSALGLFDNNYASYLQREDWDFGGAYPGGDKGITAELDGVYDLGMIAFAEPLDLGVYSYLTVQYWDENGVKKTVENAALSTRRSGNRYYYLIKFKEAVRTSKIQFGIGRYNGGLRKVTISEIRFYEYDSLEQDIMNLYTDDLHILLREDVTAKTIEELQKRLDTKDPVSGEYHPERDYLQKELDAAKNLLETGNLGGVLQVNPEITSQKDKEIAVGGLNAWQPLGITAAADEELVVYVGCPGMKEGASANVKLVFTQQHAEVGSLSSTMSLKIGRNEITVPKICTTNKERGGALYIQYTGNNMEDAYAVRVSGGTAYPVLRLYGVSGEEKNQRIQAYVSELETYVSELSGKHEEIHGSSANQNTAYAYNAKECILNLTDIQTDQMMFSLPASQVMAGLKPNPAEKLSSTVDAMEGMLRLFYQHKGLTDSFAEGTSSGIINKNHLPYQYLNIRYMQMFSGAFMYAAGNHVGIEWNETAGMMGGVPVVSDDAGRYQSGRYYGWGIAHEIGHEINQGAYAHAEVTNNYFSILAQARDTNETVRFQYPKVFEKVTSNTEGYADNVFTQLGMYWQLHLAYDRDYNFKTYGTYQEIFDNLFFARVDSYARDTSRAPSPGGVALTLNGGRDQNLMRLASAAAERDLSEFFTRWGMSIDTATMAYMKQFAPETRAIYYVDDAARVYEMEHGAGETFTGRDMVSARVSVDKSQVTITMTSGASGDLLQGYEITRVFTEQGRERRETAGFTQTGTFTDHVAYAANHVIRYEVTAIDKYMNRSNVCEAGAVKIDGDGLLDKSSWTVSTNMISDEDSKPEGTEESPCESDNLSAVVKTIDNSRETTFTGMTESEDPYILLELNQSMEVSALEYTLSAGSQAVTDYKIEISEDGQVYRQVGTGTFELSGGKEIVYFNNGKDEWVCTYDARYVRLTAVGGAGKKLSVSELELYGPSGDNVEFMSAADGQKAVGILSSDYVYDKKTGEKIPRGSIVFTGTYKGNPAYNVVVLYDEEGEIVGGVDEKGTLTAHQIILADVPEHGLLGETSDGTWIYWIEPNSGISASSLPQKVRAELYRVDNAVTNEGQRLVSDTAFTVLPASLPQITLGNGGI